MKDRSSSAVLCPIGFVVVGCMGESALRRTLPAIFRLFCSNSVVDLKVVGVCMNQVTQEQFRAQLETHLGAGDQDAFISRCGLVCGDFQKEEVQDAVVKELDGINKILVYFNPPLMLYEVEVQGLADKLKQLVTGAPDGWLRCVVEKPLGRDLTTSCDLSRRLVKAFDGEPNIFRLDHFLGKEMVQNIVAIRFANRFLEPCWNNHHINAVVISCREAQLVSPGEYSEYFDKHGIIREIMCDHLLHILAMIAMETPVSLTDERSLRDEIAKVLRCVEPARMEHTVLGQYSGYLDTDGVRKDSTTPTFACCVLYINCPRWYGVPFILKAGKGMYERRTDVRIQFKPPHNMLFPASVGGGPLNELVIRVQPNSDIYMKMMRKVPGLKLKVAPTKLDLLGTSPSLLMDIVGKTGLDPATHATRDSSDTPRFAAVPTLNSYSPDSYERLLYDVIKNNAFAFTRSDELEALWRIFTPLLDLAESDPSCCTLHCYDEGGRGPEESYTLMTKVGFTGYKLESELLGVRPKSAMHRYLEQFNLSVYQMEEIISNFNLEFQRGLRGEDSTIKMLPSFVTTVPDGTEKGVYYALDLGGTNFRVTRFVFDGRGFVEMTDERKYTVPDDKMLGTAEELFDFLAECVASLDLPGDKPRHYGFTFSFPVDQEALDRGRLMTWTKGFKTSGVVNEDVVKLLKDALDRIGFEANVNALVNDTVGTLITTSYHDPHAMIGVILGTGTNAAYIEQVENIEKLPQEIRDKGGEMVINTEWGNFGSASKMLPVTDVDEFIDKNSRNQGQQIYEKMISGLYLGEIARGILERLHTSGEIWNGPGTTVPEHLFTPHSFESRFLSDIEYDMSDMLVIVSRVEKQFGVLNSTLQDRIKLKEVCGMVVQRAAKLTACAITAAIRQIGQNQRGSITVGIDGSVYQHHPSFRQRLNTALGEVGVTRCNVVLAKDGSGLGAALIACGAAK